MVKRSLDHPRVVKVHGYTECPIGFYMNYVDGPSLRQLPTIIEEPGELLRFLILVGETIAHAHSRGVYHRDIKPENILATYRQEDHTWLPYLTDFDLAWFSQATRVTKDVWANLSYAAPEQLGNPRSNAAHRPQVDIYAFGQLAYFSVTGSDPVPVGLANNYKLLQERLAQWPVGEAAARFGSWYEICVKDDPDERYPKFQSAMDELVDIELSLRDWAKTAVSDDNVLLEIAFSLSGFGATKLSSYHEAFPSISGRTRVALEIVSRQQSATKNLLSIEAQLTLERVGLEGVSSNERARAILNGRIDEVLRAFAGARRRPGTHGSFETFVIVRDVSRDRQGIEYARRLLNLVIQSIER